MINNYSEIISYDEGDDYFQEFLKKRYLWEIFKPLQDDFPINEVFVGVVKFILYGFSLESEMLNTGGISWDNLARRIFTKVGLPEVYYDEVARLRNDNLRLSIDRWIKLQNDDNFAQYVSYRGLRSQFLSIMSLPEPKIKNDDGTTDLDAYAKIKSIVDGKMAAAENARELMNMMNEAKSSFIQNHAKLKVSVGAANEMSMQKNTASIEDFINRNK
jgi:hypothetical protein